MESLFEKDPAERAPLTPYEQIQAEITHLQKKTSVREQTASRNKMAITFTVLVFCTLIGLYIMDPFFYALHKTEAIRTYLYLHNYDSGSQVDALIASHIFSEDEIAALNRQQGSFQDYYASPAEAEREAKTIVSYIQGLHDLRAGQYDQLDPIGKVRFVLFIRSGLEPPTSWKFLNPTIAE
jgi:hypothetical protein